MTSELFDSAVRSKGDLAGVFEYDGRTAYFYLYEISNTGSNRVRDSLHVLSGSADMSSDDVSVYWDETEVRVGLFIRETLWAVFNARESTKFGGNYVVGGEASIPSSEVFLKLVKH